MKQVHGTARTAAAAVAVLAAIGIPQVTWATSAYQSKPCRVEASDATAVAETPSAFRPDDSARLLVADLRSGDLDRRQQAIVKLHQMGKDAIPVLIDGISDAEPSKDLLADPRSSLLPKRLFNYTGELNAYLIELILGRGTIQIRPSGSRSLMGGCCENYLYQMGQIFGERGKSIRESGLPEVQLAYRAWWREHQARPLAELRSDWKRHASPLSGAKYYWQ